MISSEKSSLKIENVVCMIFVSDKLTPFVPIKSSIRNKTNSSFFVHMGSIKFNSSVDVFCRCLKLSGIWMFEKLSISLLSFRTHDLESRQIY